MRDEECVALLQWAVPQMHMRWPGFRKVRAQVCKRIQRRIHQLGLGGAAEYRAYLAAHGEEWNTLDGLCRVTISRFYRDKQMFAFLEQTVLPALAARAVKRGDPGLQVWSAGAGSGEEPYTLAIIWRLRLQERYPQLGLHILASDADPRLIDRSRRACYEFGCVKNLPVDWREQVFSQRDDQYCLDPAYRQDVEFIVHDVREPLPAALRGQAFDMVLCRNLAFTYFDVPLQQRTLARLSTILRPGGALVIGIHETLPEGVGGLGYWSQRLRVFQKRQGAA